MNDTFTIPRPPGVSAELALLLYGLGFSIIPVPLGEKTPTFAWKRYQSERADADQIRAWFPTPQNAAIICGAISNTVVVDCDSPEALAWAVRHLRPTPRQVLTSRGTHLHYRHPGVEVRNRARIETGDGRLALDIRADGGFVISPFSIHASGDEYHPIGDWDAPERDVPVFDPQWLVTRRPTPRPPTPRAFVGSTGTERARRYLAATPVPIIGQGSDAETFRLAAKLVRDFAVGEADAVDLLDAWTAGRDGWDRRWLADKVSHAIRYGREPIGAAL